MPSDELWRTDGTQGGTYSVVAFPDGTSVAAVAPAPIAGGGVFFALAGAAAEQGLWISDGSGPGTTRLADVKIPSSVSNYGRGAAFQVLSNGVLVFAVEEPNAATRLWRSDGTAEGTMALGDVQPAFEGFVAAGTHAYFTTRTGPRELWRSDGTAEGTVAIPLPDGVAPFTGFGSGAPLGNQLLFRGSDAAHGAEPWITDGATATMIGDLRPGIAGSLGFDYSLGSQIFATVGSRVVFTADDGVHGAELWTTDGSPAGTHLLAELAPGGASPTFDVLQLRTPSSSFGGRIYFRDYDPVFGRRLWSSDGTPAGTQLVRVIAAQTSAFNAERRGFYQLDWPHEDCLATAGGRLVFGASRDAHDREPWLFDIGTSTTPAIVDVEPGARGSYPGNCSAARRRPVFEASAYTASIFGLWSVDGAGAAESLAVTDGSSSRSAPRTARLGDQHYVLSSRALLATDGTAANTTVVASSSDGTLVELVASADRLLVAGPKLYESDGAPGALTLVQTDSGGDVVMPLGLSDVAGIALFSAVDGGGRELWRVDDSGVAARVTDVAPGPACGIPTVPELLGPVRPAAVDELYFFVGDDGTTGQELWVSDGTADGTRLVVDLVPGSYPSSPRELTAFGSYVYFVAESSPHGRELWRSDGTAKGTELVADLVPGTASSLPQQLTRSGGMLHFSAWTPTHGREPWRVRTPGAAPERVADIAAGPLSSSPIRFHVLGGRTFTLANDNYRGFELWKVEPEGLIFADPFEHEDVEDWSAVAPAP